MIKSFSDKDTRKVFEYKFVKHWSNIYDSIRKKMRILDSANSLDKLSIISSNRLHKLHGEYEGYWSISINLQYRIIFQWENDNAYNVKVCDYH